MDKGVLNIVIVVLLAICVWVYILWVNSRKMSNALKQASQQQNLVRHDDRARKLCRAIHLLHPNLTAGIDFIIRHDSPEEEPYIAEWMSSTSRPTAEEINSALVELADARHEEKYSALRRAEYPSVGEQLDAAYQARQGDNTKQLQIDEKIRRVKEKYPKMDECI